LDASSGGQIAGSNEAAQQDADEARKSRDQYKSELDRLKKKYNDNWEKWDTEEFIAVYTRL